MRRSYGYLLRSEAEGAGGRPSPVLDCCSRAHTSGGTLPHTRPLHLPPVSEARQLPAQENQGLCATLGNTASPQRLSLLRKHSPIQGPRERTRLCLLMAVSPCAVRTACGMESSLWPGWESESAQKLWSLLSITAHTQEAAQLRTGLATVPQAAQWLGRVPQNQMWKS